MIRWIEYGEYWIEVKPVEDQSGMTKVIQHTYYLKEDIDGCKKKKGHNKESGLPDKSI